MCQEKVIYLAGRCSFWFQISIWAFAGGNFKACRGFDGFIPKSEGAW